MPKDAPTTEAAPAVELVLIEVLETGTVIGGHKKAVKHQERIPLDEAKRLEALGKVKVLGI